MYYLDSFVTYNITCSRSKKAYSELYSLLTEFCKKYKQKLLGEGDFENGIVLASSYEVEEYLENGRKYFNGQYLDEWEPIMITMWTPGLSCSLEEFDSYYGNEDEYDGQCFGFAVHREEGFPPIAEVAIAVIFGPKGDDENYLSELDENTKLIDDNGNLLVSTYLTKDEAKVLFM